MDAHLISSGFPDPRKGIPFDVLAFTRVSGFVHPSIPGAIAGLERLGQSTGFGVCTTDDPAQFTDKNLSRYGAVLFLLTSGSVLEGEQKAALVRYIRAGGGFAGIHSATATEKEWPWFTRLTGAIFMDHPEEQEATVQTVDRQHPATAHLPERWRWTDEWYNYKALPEGVRVLLTVDEATYQGGRHGTGHPVSWCHEYDGGRSFVTSLGHDASAWGDARYIRHILGGIRYAAGVPGRG